MLHTGFSAWGPDGSAQGIEVHLVEQAAKRLGKTVRWVERPFPELFDALERGEIDIAVSTIGITSERQQRVAFSVPYFETEIVALVQPNSPIQRLEELKAGRIGADQATTAFPAARKRWPAAQILGTKPADKSWPQMVHEGVIDAFVVDGSDQERLEGLSRLSLRRISERLAEERFAVALRKGFPAWTDALNQAIVQWQGRVCR
jgi:ABC-type amino acid transport substrate-binding protein